MNTDEIRKMVEIENKSFSQIARELDINVGRISHFCKKNKIESKHKHKAIKKSFPINEIFEKYKSGTSLDKLRKDYNTSVLTLKRHLSRDYPDLKYRSIDEAKRPSSLNDKEKFEELSSKYSFREIARKLGVRANTVCAAGKRLGVKSAFDFEEFDASIEVLHDLYVKKEMTISQIAQYYNKSYGIVLRKLRKLGFVIAKPGGRPYPSKHYKLNDKDWLYNQYITRKRSMGDLASEIGTRLGNISYYLRKYNIKLRTKEEYIKLLLDRSEGCFYHHSKKLDSKLEKSFMDTLDNPKFVLRNVEFESKGSICFIDFLYNGNYYEVKSREGSVIPGPNRRRLVKQILVAKANDVDVKIWNGKIYNFEITEEDKYYCINWKLIFNNPNECFEWLLDYGFRGICFPICNLCKAIKGNKAYKVKPGLELNANIANELAINFLRHFSQHYWCSTHKGYSPITKVWEPGNMIILRDAVCKLWEEKREVNLYGLVKLIGKFYKDFATVSVFKPWIARHIYDRYLPNGGTIIDPCMGWGGRLLATLDSNYKYIGYDLNENAVQSHKHMRKFLGSRLVFEPRFICDDSSRCDFEEADLLFTSPPYDDKESYYGLARQCTDTTNIYKNIFRSSIKIIILNIPKDHLNLCIGIARGQGFALKEQLDMKTASFLGREKTSEPILVFRRKG